MFGGTGTVAVVSVKTGRNFIHIDISEEYNKTAKKRLSEVKDQLKLNKFVKEKHKEPEPPSNSKVVLANPM